MIIKDLLMDTLRFKKHFGIFMLTAAGTLCLSSCIKDEAPNAECDIEQAVMHTANPSDLFHNAYDTLKVVASADSVVEFKVKINADLTALAPQFKITEGATIEPASGTVHDFSKGGVHYTVTSEDKAWHRDYVVRFKPDTLIVSDTLHYDFENYALEPSASKYYLWYDVAADGTPVYNWATGNPGFKLSKSSALPMEYPTIPYDNGRTGKAVQLTTRSTGGFGAMVNMRIASGNLFLGTFDAAYALRDAMAATCFGLPFTKQPDRLIGYYQYTPGATYQDKLGNAVAGKVDNFDIYAVLYRNTDAEGKAVMLHGDDVLTSPYIAGLARITKREITTSWTRFEIPFDYDNYGGAIDQQLLASHGYNLAVVFASSIDGASFCGAVGSTLLVDDVQLICKEAE
jgi:hypothetical protein